MSTMTKNDKNQAVISLEISKEAMDAATEAAFQKNKGRYAIPGFRKGKAPRKMVEQYYGAGVFFDDAINSVFPDLYDAAVKEHELTPVDQPDVQIEDITDEGVIKLTATVTLKPEVTLGKYEGIKVDLVEYTVTDEDVDHELHHALEHASRIVDVEDRPVKEGDTVTLNYSGSVDGEKFEGGTAENQTLEIGSHSFIPGFEEQMVGMNIGEEKSLNVTFPEDYHAEDLKGKAAVFEVKVLGIKEKEVPALDDEFAKDVSEFDTLDEYKADIRKHLEESKKKQADSEMENKMIDAIADEATVDIPACMVEHEIDDQIRDMEIRMSYQGLKFEDYLKYTGMTMDQVRDMQRENAQKTVKVRLVMEELVKAMNVEATDEETQAELTKYAESYGQEAEEFKKTLNEGQLDYFKQMAVINKTIALLKEKNPATKAAKKPAKKATKKAAPKAEKEAAEEAPAADKTEETAE